MKKVILMLLICSMIFSMCSCGPLEKFFKKPISDEEIIEEQRAIVKIGFSNSEDEDEIEKVLTLDELKNWENPYEKYRSSVMHNTLTADEQLAYRALEYALVHSYRYTFLDTRLSISQLTAEEILNYLSYDSPLLEQNLICTTYVNAAFYDYKTDDGRTVEVLHRSTTVSVSNFKEELWHKKMLALEKAKHVFAELNTGGTQVELAERLYRYVAESIEYDAYLNERNWYKGDLAPFLYDAFINEKTHCDGFTNALALLFSLAGFEHVEKGDTTNVETGHTWNCVKLNDVWYNCDATAAPFIPYQSDTMGSGLFFAFGDYLQTSLPNHYGRYPECNSSLYMNPDAYLQNCDNNEFYNAICKGFEAHEFEWALVLVDEFNSEKANDKLQLFADTYEMSIEVCTKNVKDDKTAVFVYKQGMLDS